MTQFVLEVSNSMPLETIGLSQTVAARRQGGHYYPCRKILTVSVTLVVRGNVVHLCIPDFSSFSPVSKIKQVYKRSVLCNTQIRCKDFEKFFSYSFVCVFSHFCLCFLLTHISTGSLYYLHRKLQVSVQSSVDNTSTSHPNIFCINHG